MTRSAITTLGIAIFLAGAACKEAWMSAGYPLRPDGGLWDLISAAFAVVVVLHADRIARRRR